MSVHFNDTPERSSSAAQSDQSFHQLSSDDPPAQVLVLAARPMDVVLGCGGALFEWTHCGSRAITVIALSDAEARHASPPAIDLIGRLTAGSDYAAEALGCDLPRYWRAPSLPLVYSERTIAHVVKMIEAVDASLVLAPSPEHPETDRRIFALIAREAVRRTATRRRLAFYWVAPVVPEVFCAERALVSDSALTAKRAALAFLSEVSQPDQAPAAQTALDIEYFNLQSKGDFVQPAAGSWRCGTPGRLTPQEDKPLVSILIRTTGRTELSTTLDSVAAQTYSNIEVILVDVLEGASFELETICSGVSLHLLSKGESLARARACNVALDLAKGTYVTFLDDDDWIFPDHIARLVNALEASDKAAAYAGVECRQYHSGNDWQLVGVYNCSYDPKRLEVDNFLPIHSVLFERRLAGSTLQFDERFDIYEDWDFWLQLSALTSLVHVDKITAVYRISANSGFGLHEGGFAAERAYGAIIDKWHSRWNTQQLVHLARDAAAQRVSLEQQNTQAKILALSEKAGASEAGKRDLKYQLEQRTRELEQIKTRAREDAEEILALKKRCEVYLKRENAELVELDRALRTQKGRTNELRRRISDQKEEIGELRHNLRERDNAVNMQRQLKDSALRRLDRIQTSASWGLSAPVRVIETRYPGTARKITAFPRILWWSLTLRLRRRLKIRRLARRIIGAGLYDPEWYVVRNPDVVLSGLNPLAHWITTGWREGRDPHPAFETAWYISQHPEIRESGINPLEHYLTAGIFLGVPINPTAHPDLPQDVLTQSPRGRSRIARLWQKLEGSGMARSTGARPRRPVALSDERRRALPEGNVAACGTPTEPNAADTYVADLQQPLVDSQSLAVRAIAFYLPQFHPIPENDEWWGEGFTEWTNVVRAAPHFAGHDQPRVPGALGFYDLRAKDVQHAQIALAKKYGIQGFCYHFYWFAGKRVLERPLQQVLADPSLDLPFCICWANENWTRRWDGEDQEVLIAQDYSPAGDIDLFSEIAPLFADERYITVGERPVVLVYRPQSLPDPRATAERWRDYAKSHGLPDPYLINVLSFSDPIDPRDIGFDAAVEFPPHQFPRADASKRVSLSNPGFRGYLLDYQACVDEAEARRWKDISFRLYPGVMAAWDNTARRLDNATVFVGASPEAYGQWLRAACDRASAFDKADERMVFINAWNEWAEGTYLEPDRRHGYAYLRKTREILEEGPAKPAPSQARHERPQQDRRFCRGILLVGHDAHAHGAQLLLLNLAATFSQRFGLNVLVWLLEEGELADDYRRIAEVHIGKPSRKSERWLRTVRRRGFAEAITNTTVTGTTVPQLKSAGFRVISLVHEMPQLVRERGLETNARNLCESADRVVFAAETVKDAFKTLADLSRGKCVVLPQGVYQSLDCECDSRASVEKELGLPADAVLVLNVGYADSRKGFDWFLDCARYTANRDPRFHFLWVGKLSPEYQGRFDIERCRGRLVTHLHQLPFTHDIARYFNAANLFLLTSREDPFPSVVLEALSCGLPVVAFEDTGGHCELLEDSTLGSLAAPMGDITALSAALSLTAATDEAQPDRINDRIQLARERFDFPNYAWDLLRLTDPNLRTVSVIVPNYNYGEYLEQRLDSIFLQTYPVFEIILLDDASTDESISIAQRVAASQRRLIRIVHNKTNSGSAFKQWAKGVRESQGDLQWIAEADDVAEPEFLRRVVHAANSAEDVRFAFCDSGQLDVRGVKIGASYADYCNEFSDLDFRSDFGVAASEFLANGLSVKNTILNVSAVLFARQPLVKALQRVESELGQWNIAGDWRLYIELCCFGGQVCYVAQALNLHRRHSKSIVGANHLLAHVEEISKLQRISANLTNLDPKVLEQQSSYIASLERRALGTGSHGVGNG